MSFWLAKADLWGLLPGSVVYTAFAAHTQKQQLN